MTSLQTQLEQSRLRETELLGALKEMQDKVLDLEKVRYRGGGGGRNHRVHRVQYLQALLLDGNLMYMISRYWSWYLFHLHGAEKKVLKYFPLPDRFKTTQWDEIGFSIKLTLISAHREEMTELEFVKVKLVTRRSLGHQVLT